MYLNDEARSTAAERIQASRARAAGSNRERIAGALHRHRSPGTTTRSA